MSGGDRLNFEPLPSNKHGKVGHFRAIYWGHGRRRQSNGSGRQNARIINMISYNFMEITLEMNKSKFNISPVNQDDLFTIQ